MVRKTVRFSLLLLDDFSGESIVDKGQVFRLDGRLMSPVHKPDGFYVFTQPEGPHVKLEIFGGHYFPEELSINIDELDPLYPVVVVRLVRKRSFGTYDCEYLEGDFKPNERIYALKKTQSSNRLLEIREEEGKTIVAFSGYFIQGAGETRFLVGTGKKQEMLITGPVLPDKTIEIRGNLKFQHKAGEVVVRAYSAYCDDKGHFAIPVDKGQKELIDRIIFYNKEDEEWGCSSLTGPN